MQTLGKGARIVLARFFPGARDREYNKMASSPTALQYLDKAVGSLRKLGLFPETKSDPAPVVAMRTSPTNVGTVGPP